MAGITDAPQAGSAASLVESVETFRRSREILKRLYENCQTYCEDIRELYDELVKDDDEGKLVFLTEEDKERVGKIMEKDPVIVISGKQNCGKTSLINELLEGDYFKCKALPNTARLTRIKYAENSYIKVIAPDGTVMSEDAFTKKALKKLVDLDSKNRKREDQVRVVIEVGLDHPLLRDGLQIIDVPGLDENDQLTHVVKDLLDGVLQTLVYVIDGTDGVRQLDEDFILKLKEKSPSLEHVILVCNKAELDQEATEANTPEGGPQDDWAPQMTDRERAKYKTDLVRSRLTKRALLPKRSNSFHGISCLRKKQARKANITNEFVEDFNRLREAITQEYKNCLHKEIREAAKRIADVRIRLFTLIHDDKPTLIRRSKKAMQDAEKANTRYEKLKETISNLRPQVEEWLKLNQAEIKEVAVLITTRSRGRNEDVDEYKADYHTLLSRSTGCAFLSLAVDDTLEKILQTFRNEVKDDVIEINILDDVSLFYDYFSSVLVNKEDGTGYQPDNDDEREWQDKTKKVVAIVLAKELGGHGTYRSGDVNPAWKNQTVQDILDALDMKIVADCIIKSLLAYTDQQHGIFLEHTLSIHSSKALKSTGKSSIICQKLLSDDSSFAEDCYRTKALITTLARGRLPPGPVIARGTTAVITAVDDHVVAKKFTNREITKEICIRHAYAFFGDKVHGLVELNDVILDQNWEPVYLLKKYRCRLDDALREGLGHTVHARLQALLDACKTIRGLISKGLKVRQVYPRYFLVDDQGDRLVIAYNLFKWAPHDQDETIAVQLGKLLALMFHGRYDEVLGEDPTKDDCMTVLDDTLSPRMKTHLSEMLRKYIFPGDAHLTMTMFIEDLEELKDTAKTSPGEDCITS